MIYDNKSIELQFIISIELNNCDPSQQAQSNSSGIKWPMFIPASVFFIFFLSREASLTAIQSICDVTFGAAGGLVVIKYW